MLRPWRPASMRAGGRCIINGFSLEPNKLDGILPLARQYDVDIIGYLLHSNSQVPIDAAEMMEVAVALFGAYTGRRPRSGPPDHRSGRGTSLLAGWGEPQSCGAQCLSVCCLICWEYRSALLPASPISLRGRRRCHARFALECTFLPMLAAAGLGYGADQRTPYRHGRDGQNLQRPARRADLCLGGPGAGIGQAGGVEGDRRGLRARQKQVDHGITRR